MAGEKIFISHSHFDNDVCERLYTWLTTELGADVFFDREQAYGGDEWLDRIQTALEARPIFLLALSKHSVAATWVRAETHLALDLTFTAHTHRIIPVSFDPSLTHADIDHLSSFLNLFQRIDLSPGAPESHWEELKPVITGAASERATDHDAVTLAPHAEQALALVGEAREAFQQGMWHDVTLFARRALEYADNTHDERLYAMIAQAQYALGDQQAAIMSLRNALAINGFRANYWLLLARWLLALTPPDMAAAQTAWENAYITTYGRANREQILREQVQWMLALGDGQRALVVCQRGLQFDASSADWLRWKQDAEQAAADASSRAERQSGAVQNAKFEKFTDRARKVLSLAQEQAQRFDHNYIGTEHILLGLIAIGDGVGLLALRSLGVDPNKVRSAVEFIITRDDRVALGEIGLTIRAKKVVELAVDEARRLDHHYIGTEHLLLGLIREGEGIAAGVLESLGITLEQARAAVIRALASPAPVTMTESGSIMQRLAEVVRAKEQAIQSHNDALANELNDMEARLRALIGKLTDTV